MTPFKLSSVSGQKVIDYQRRCASLSSSNWNIREQLRSIDLTYMREKDWTEQAWKAEQALRRGDADKFRNITIPVVLPKVEAAVTYQQSVFLTGQPIFSCVSVPEFADEATQMDTVIGSQQDYANWVPHLLKCLRDGFKYNLQACEVTWQEDKTYSLTTALDYQAGKEGKPTETLWSGNKLKRMDLYNTFWDTRVDPCDIAEKGEFAGYNEPFSRIALKQLLQTLPSKQNVTEAFESGFQAPVSTIGSAGNLGYYYPQLNPDAAFDQTSMYGMNWALWAGFEASSSGGSNIKYHDMYIVTTLYARILPSDFEIKGVPGPNTAQVWKFLIVNSQVVIYAEQLTNAHNLIPIIFASPLDDGLGYQTKSFAKNVEPIQQITTALSNSVIASRRRAISDRGLYDPSRVSAAAINNDSPNAKIPVRPSAYGKPLNEAYYPIPFRDDQFQITSTEIQFYSAYANEITGLNPARQGQFVKGNKTKSEFDTVMSNANGRDQTTSLILEGNFFGPIKKIIRSNILQYQGGITLFNKDEERTVSVDPVALRKANLTFQISDGLMPSDKIIDGDTLTAATQLFIGNQQIGAEYNVGDMAAYLFASRGLKLQTFKKDPKQVAFEQAQAQWQGAIQALSLNLSKSEMTPEQVQEVLQSLPQPTPEQFGYVPGAPKLTPGAPTTPNSPTIISSVSSKIQAFTQAAQQQATPQGGAGSPASASPTPQSPQA